MMRKFYTLLACLMVFVSFSQNASNYKYIIVPKKFDFLKKENEHNLNALTKMVFEKQGYEVYYESDILPQDLAENRCKALYAAMLENNTLFMTKIRLELKDCKSQVVFVSEEGVSREKEYSKAYVQAFRPVGKSVEALKSQPKSEPVVLVNSSAKTENTTVVPQLFAQPTTNGYQLIDTTPKVIIKLFKTSINNFYIGQKETVQGIVFNKNNQWFFEYYQNEKLITEQLEIKF